MRLRLRLRGERPTLSRAEMEAERLSGLHVDVPATDELEAHLSAAGHCDGPGWCSRDASPGLPRVGVGCMDPFPQQGAGAPVTSPGGTAKSQPAPVLTQSAPVLAQPAQPAPAQPAIAGSSSMMMSMRERRVAANATGRDAILMPGMPGAPRGPAAAGSALASRPRLRQVQFTPAPPLVQVPNDDTMGAAASDSVPAAQHDRRVVQSTEGSGPSRGGNSSEDAVADFARAVSGGVEGVAGDDDADQGLRRLSFELEHAETNTDTAAAGPGGFSWSLLTSGSELVDMVSSYLPSFSSPRGAGPSFSSPCGGVPTSSAPGPLPLSRTNTAIRYPSEDPLASSSGSLEENIMVQDTGGEDGRAAAPYSRTDGASIPTLALPEVLSYIYLFIYRQGRGDRQWGGVVVGVNIY